MPMRCLPAIVNTPGNDRPVHISVKEGNDHFLANARDMHGAPPFTFFANGAPIGQSAFARQESWMPDGPGFVTLSVVDAKGRSDKVKVSID